jgi:DNA-binding CsgD family transcriptional regulator
VRTYLGRGAFPRRVGSRWGHACRKNRRLARRPLPRARPGPRRLRTDGREQEVLDCILQSLANKEIAAKLNVAERTVKFHVSSLLAKFGVTDRVALSREASLGRMPALTSAGQISPETLFGFPVRGQQGAPEESPAASAPEKTPTPPREAPRTRNRLLPMFTRERFAT